MKLTYAPAAGLAVALAIGFPATLSAQTPPPQTQKPQTQKPAAEPGDAPEPIALRLANHTILVGVIVSEDAETIVLDAGSLGRITLKAADVIGRLDPELVASVGAPPPPPATTPEAAPSYFAPPGQVRWVRTLDVNGSYNSAIYEQGPVIGAPVTGAQLGLTGDQYTIMGQLTLLRASDQHLAYFNGSYQLAVYKPAGAASDMPKVSVGYSFRRKNSDRYFYTTLYEYYSDAVRRIAYSHQAFVGIGFQAVRKPKLSIDVVPMLGMINEDKGTEFDGEWLEGMGGLWQLTYTHSPQIQIEQRETFHLAFNHSDYYGVETYVGFRGMLSPKFGLTAGMTHTYDKALESVYLVSPALPGVRVFANKPSFVKFTTGVHIGF